MDDVIRAMPHALGIEKALISMMLKDNLVQYPRFIEAGLTMDMFYLPSHVKIGAIISQYSAKNQEIELIGFINSLIDADMLDSLGGPAAITELFSYALNDNQFDSFCEILRNKFILRQLIKMNDGKEFEVECIEDLNELLSEKEAKLSEISALLHPKSDSSVAGSIQSVMSKFKELITSDDPKSMFGHMTGFHTMDNCTLGLKAGEVFVLGARPSVGKTALMTNIINNVCIDQSVPSLVFSCEMTQEQIISRMIYSKAKIPFHKLTDRTGIRYVPTKSELIRMREAVTVIQNAPIYIEDKGGITIDDLRTTARRHKRQFGIRFIAIDYLQLIRCFTKMAQTSKNAEVTEVSAALKALAKELDVSILLLSQLKRSSAGTKPQKPKMSDLRDSGSIEQDADIIGLLHRYDYEGDVGHKGEAEINLAKNRNGPTRIIDLEWDAEITQFKEKAYQQPE